MPKAQKEACVDDSNFLPSEFFSAEERPIAGRITLWFWGFVVYLTIGGYGLHQFWKEYNITTDTQTTKIEPIPIDGQDCSPLSVQAAVGEVPFGLQDRIKIAGIDYPSLDDVLSKGGDIITRSAYAVSSTTTTCKNTVGGDITVPVSPGVTKTLAGEGTRKMCMKYLNEIAAQSKCTDNVQALPIGVTVKSTTIYNVYRCGL